MNNDDIDPDVLEILLKLISYHKEVIDDKMDLHIQAVIFLEKLLEELPHMSII